MRQRLVALTVLSLCLLVILPACSGNGGDKTPAIPLTPTIIVSQTTLTATPTSVKSPVKIGAVAPWSGSMAMTGFLADQIMAVVEDQVKNMGGILGGRQIKFIRGDDRGVVAESAAQAEKLILDDKVSALTLGGVSAAHINAVADIAEELKVPFIGFATLYNAAARKYSACLYFGPIVRAQNANFITNLLKPKTVAFLGYSPGDGREVLEGLNGKIAGQDQSVTKGIDIVYEQYFSPGTLDFTPYLTKIKYVNPDLVVMDINTTEVAVTINKQIMELGGWGGMKVYYATEVNSGKSVASMPAAVGTYTALMWLQGSNDPGMKAFEDAYQHKYGRLPSPEVSYFYNCFWVAIKAIELAGTDDPGKVAEALRSGDLAWESAWGHMRIGTDGTGQIKSMVAQVQEGGKLVKVSP